MGVFSSYPVFRLGGVDMLTVPTVTQLADFSGRPEAEYPVFANAALRQATLLMKLRTCLVSAPADSDKAELLTYGILELADDLILKQPHQKVRAKPFSSETIMSYSYSKAATKAVEGKKTGLMWFDLAVQELSVCDSTGGGDIGSGSVSVFENDGLCVDSEGRARVLGPSDIEPQPGWYSTNSIAEVR